MGCQTIVINRGLNDSAFKKIARRILRFLRVQRYCTIQNKIDGDNPLKRFIANTFQRTVLYDSNFKIKKFARNINLMLLLLEVIRFGDLILR